MGFSLYTDVDGLSVPSEGDTLRDWSLIMGRGELQNGGRHVKFHPYEKGGRKKF